MPFDLIGALTIPYRLDGRPAFDQIMDAWQRDASALVPTRADSVEPVRRPFDLANRDDAFKSWGQSIWIGTRPKPKMEMNVLTGPFLHSNVNCRIQPDGEAPLPELTALISSLASVTRPDYGMVHALSNAEAAEARASHRPDLMVINRVTGESTLGVGFTRQLERGIPSLYWLNLFGPPYIAMFGRGRLLAAPAAIVREEPWGIIIQVSVDPPSEATWSVFRDRCEALADYLGRDAFWPVGQRIPKEIGDFEPPPLVGHM